MAQNHPHKSPKSRKFVVVTFSTFFNRIDPHRPVAAPKSGLSRCLLIFSQFMTHSSLTLVPSPGGRGRQKPFSLREKGGDEGSDFELKFCHVFWKAQ